MITLLQIIIENTKNQKIFGEIYMYLSRLKKKKTFVILLKTLNDLEPNGCLQNEFNFLLSFFEGLWIHSFILSLVFHGLILSCHYLR